MPDLRFPIVMLIALVMGGILYSCSPAIAEDCDKSEKVVIGDKQVVVKDPLALLRQARNGGAKKTQLNAFLGCHPVLKTIAADNGMNCEEFLVYTGVLTNFNMAFQDLIILLPPDQIQQTYDALLQQVVESVIEQILAPRSPA